MRRIPLVKLGAVNASIIPAKRNGNILHSVMLFVIGVVFGAVCVLLVIGRSMAPTTPSPTHYQPERDAGNPIVAPDPLAANYSGGPVGKTFKATIVKDRSIASLLQLLTSDLEQQREEAAYALEVAALDHNCLDEIALAGAIPILRGIIESATETNEDVLSKVIGLLSSFIIGNHPVRIELMQDGFFRHFITLAKDGVADVKVPAAKALLGALSYTEKSALNETLSIVTDLVWNGNDGVREQVASWLRGWYRDSSGAAVPPEVILALFQILKVGPDQAKVYAADLLATPSFVGVHRVNIVDGGGVPLLVPMLTNRKVQSAVIRALLLFTTEYPETLAQVASVGLPTLQRTVEQGAGVYDGDSWFVGYTYTLCVNLARDPEAAALMVQAGMLPLWVRLSQEGQGEARRQAGRVVTYLSRVTAAQGQSQGHRAGDVPPPNNPSVRRRDP
jgi:hypothetical protein